MNETIHLYSKNLKLLKYFIDYSFISELYDLTLLSTNFKFPKHIDSCSIVIIDLPIDINVKILYNKICQAYKEITPVILLIDVYGVSANLEFQCDTRVTYDNENFFDVLNTIYTIHYNRDNNHWLIEDRLLKIMSQLHLKSNLKGYVFLKEAILLKLEDESSSLKEIIDIIARHNNSTSSRVERSIRHIIFLSYDTNQEVYKQLLSFYDRPSSKHLISKIIHFIKS